MTITAAALRELHRIHRQVTDLRGRLERGPKQIQGNLANVARLDELVNERQETLKAAKIASDAKQLQLRSNEDRIIELKGKLNAAASNKEFQALKEQIAASEMANSVLSDEILESFDKIEELEQAVEDAKGEKGKAEEELAKTQKRVNDQQQSLETDLARVQAELVAAEGGLDEDFKVEYTRVVSSRGEDALAQVEGQNCGGCFMGLTAQMINELMLEKPVFCKSCGCLLYLPED